MLMIRETKSFIVFLIGIYLVISGVYFFFGLWDSYLGHLDRIVLKYDNVFFIQESCGVKPPLVSSFIFTYDAGCFVGKTLNDL